LYKKRDDLQAPPPKKLIAKNPGKVDDLAVEFDKKLTNIMIKLSGVLKDPLASASQKWAEIEKSKYSLYNFSSETCIQFLGKSKASISSRDAKELNGILNQIREGICASFENLGQLFYLKQDNEVKLSCDLAMGKLQATVAEKTEQVLALQQELNGL
jgi:hypothetical protein